MSHQVLRLREVEERTGLRRSAIYRLIKDGSFPAQFKITSKASGWLASSIDLWIEKRVKESREGIE